MLRSSVVMAAISLSLGLGAPAASAKPVNAVKAPGTITCSTFLGSTKYAPPLNPGESTNLVQTFKGTLSGCTASSGLSVTSGAVTATITTDPESSGFTDDCDYFTDTSVFGSGSFKVTWTSPAEAIANSSFTIGQIHNSIYNNGPQFFFDQDGGVTGSFQGSDHGSSDAFYATSATSDSSLYTSCTGTGGLKKVKLHLNPVGTQALTLG